MLKISFIFLETKHILRLTDWLTTSVYSVFLWAAAAAAAQIASFSFNLTLLAISKLQKQSFNIVFVNIFWLFNQVLVLFKTFQAIIIFF
jgi:hypothetical protein